MHKIVVGVDGSESSQLALQWALELARSSGNAVFHLIHAYDIALPMTESAAYQYVTRVESAKQEGQALLDTAARELDGFEVVTHVTQGPPAVAVLAIAEREGATCIAAGSRGLGPIAGVFLGSVSAEILHKSKCPVLVTHTARPRPIERVLVGVDGSEHSARALRTAIRWAPNASVAALNVVTLPAEESESPRAVVSRTIERADVPRARVRPLGAAGVPADQLAAEFLTGGYDLLVVGCRGLSTLGEIFLGSVSERLMRLVPGPVLVVR